MGATHGLSLIHCLHVLYKANSHVGGSSFREISEMRTWDACVCIWTEGTLKFPGNGIEPWL